MFFFIGVFDTVGLLAQAVDWARRFDRLWGFANGRNLVLVPRLIVAADTLSPPMAVGDLVGTLVTVDHEFERLDGNLIGFVALVLGDDELPSHLDLLLWLPIGQGWTVWPGRPLLKP
jgi:hypothetical protein